MGFVTENMLNNKLLMMHTAYLAKVLSVSGKTAKIQPLGMSKAYNESAQKQAVLTNVPILESAQYKFEKRKLRYVKDVVAHVPEFDEVWIVVPTDICKGDIVLCVCCDRDISQAKKGNNSTPPVGHHSMTDSVIVSVL